MMRPLTPYPVLEFVDGPAVDDTASLAAWLVAHDNDERQLRLPVSMDHLGIGTANHQVGEVVGDQAVCVAIEADRHRAGA